MKNTIVIDTELPKWAQWVKDANQSYKECGRTRDFSDQEVYERLMRLGIETKVFGLDVSMYPEIPPKVALASLRLDFATTKPWLYWGEQ